MDPQEYTNLDRVEKSHWYYAGKRELVRWWLQRHAPPDKGLRLLDCGAGTGLFAQEMAASYETHVLDDHEESLRLLRTRFPASQVHSLGPSGLPFEDASFDVITLLDVLEHIEKDQAALEGIWRVLKPGGLLVLTVPASMSLWSDWDVALHHYRRYTHGSLLEVLGKSGRWERIHSNYTNALVYPFVWLVRRLRPLNGSKRGEDYLPPRPLNAILRWLYVGQGCCRLPMPFGVSLLLVARKAN